MACRNDSLFYSVPILPTWVGGSRRRVLILLSIVVFSFLSLLSRAEAQTLEVTGSYHLRSCGGTKCRKVGGVSPGQKVRVLSRRGAWYRVSVRRGRSAWVHHGAFRRSDRERPLRGETQAGSCTSCEDGSRSSRSSGLRRASTDLAEISTAITERTVGSGWVWPVAGGRSAMSRRGFGVHKHPIKKRRLMHYGQDFRAPYGSKIMAVGNGTVVFAGRSKGYGKFVDIRHPNGLYTRYAHLSRVAVRTGQTVTRGQKIGASGSTGLSTGPHLHFECRVSRGKGGAVHPSRCLPSSGRKSPPKTRMAALPQGWPATRQES